MRRIGYGEIFDSKTQHISYVRRLSGGHYPRLHAYVDDIEGGIAIKLHLDQKKASYEGQKAHSGEYEGPIVKEEIERIKYELARIAG